MAQDTNGTHRARARRYGGASERFTTVDVIQKYGNTCHICEQPIDLNAPRHANQGWNWRNGLQLDHVVPLSKGGGHTLSNVRPAHAGCNMAKGADMPKTQPLDELVELRIQVATLEAKLEAAERIANYAENMLNDYRERLTQYVAQPNQSSN